MTAETSSDQPPEPPPKHFRCDMCGAPEWIASDQQRWRIANDKQMHCRACFKKERDSERRADALLIADKLSTPFMSGEHVGTRL